MRYHKQNSTMKLRRNSRPSQILKAVAIAGGVLALSTIAPQSGARLVQSLVKAYMRTKRFEKERFLRDLRYLQGRKLIAYRALPDGTIEMTLARRGRQETLRYSFDELVLKRPLRWDGTWRLVTFDIPHVKKAAREALRHKLYELGFYPLQKSVFIVPYPCERELDFVCTVFGIRKHVLLLPAGRFDGDDKLRHHFGV